MQLFQIKTQTGGSLIDWTRHCSSYKAEADRGNNISLGSKVKLLLSLVISTYACEPWTLTAELEKRAHVFQMRCYRRLLNISYKDHVTSEDIRRKIQAVIGKYEELLTLVKKRKLRWFFHISRSSGLAKTILKGTVKGKEEKVARRRDGKTKIRNGQGWTLLAQPGGKGLL